MRALILLFLFPSMVWAADLGGTIKVYDGDVLVLETTNRFFGLDANEAEKFTKSAFAQLDYASRHQDKGGTYKMVWQWDGQAVAVETAGMKLSAVNRTLRRGTWWLASLLDHSDASDAKGKKAFGNKHREAKK